MNDIETQSTSAAAPGAFAPNEPGGLPTSQSWLDRLREAFGFKTPANLREDLEEALSQEDALDVAFSPEERTLIRNILRLRETRVDDVMVPRADIDAIDSETPLAELILLFEQSGHSRMPVYRETLDEPIGMVHIKDLMAYLAREANRSPQGTSPDEAELDLSAVDTGRSLVDSGLIRPVLFVPPSMPATDLLAKMQATRTQMALVIDEYGGTDGLVSIEDLVETIVGEIDDEHDVEDGPMVKAISAGVYVADARADLEEVEEILGPRFDAGEHDEDVDTLGGLLVAVLGRLPVKGEVLRPEDLAGWEFEILDADDRRIRTLRMVDIEVAGERAAAARPRLGPPPAA